MSSKRQKRQKKRALSVDNLQTFLQDDGDVQACVETQQSSSQGATDKKRRRKQADRDNSAMSLSIESQDKVGCKHADIELMKECDPSEMTHKPTNDLKEEILCLQKTVLSLQAQVEFLLSYLGITDVASLPGSVQAANPNPTVVAGASKTPSAISRDPNPTVTFANAVRGSTYLSPSLSQAVVSAVYTDFDEHERRTRNIIITGLSKQTGSDKDRVQQLIADEFDVKMNVAHCRRLGRETSGRIQPLLVVLQSNSDAEFLIQNAKRLRRSSNQQIRSAVYINADLTKAEALAAYQKRCRRRQSRVAAEARRSDPAGRNPTDQNGASSGSNELNGTVMSTSQTSVHVETSLRATAASFVPNTSGQQDQSKSIDD